MARSTPKFDHERAAKVLCLASQVGDVEAAKHFGITTRTIWRYRSRIATDTKLSALFAEKRKEFEAASEGWAEEAVRFMSAAISKLSELVQQAKPEQMRDVVGAIKIVGELDITRKVLGGEQPTPNPEGTGAQANGRQGATGPSQASAPAPTSAFKH